MRKLVALLGALALVLGLLAGCSAKAEVPENTEKIGSDAAVSVVATIFPQYDFTRQVAGDFADVMLLVPPGSESHSFEPTPQDIITIQECDVFIYGGGDSDDWVERILASMDTEGMQIIAMLDLVEAVREELVKGMESEHGHIDDHGEEDHNHEHEEGHDHEPEWDEHVWTSPVNAAIIAGAIADVLCEVDTANADIYRRNAEGYAAQLYELDAAFREVVREAPRDTLVFADRFPFRYFADEYGLEYFAAFPGCSTETEASAATVAFLIDKVQDEELPAVFYIEFSNEKMADTICESTGAKKLLLHSCHNVAKDDLDSGMTYLDLMWQNVENLKEALY